MSGGIITRKRLDDPYSSAVLKTLDDLIYSQSGKRDEQIRRYTLKNANPTMRTVLRACHDYDMALAAEGPDGAHLLTTRSNVIAFACRARTLYVSKNHGRKGEALTAIGLTRGTVDGWTRAKFSWPRIGDLVKLGTAVGYRFSWYTAHNKYEV